MSPSVTQAGSSSTFNAAVNLAKYCIGAGILALPYATQQGGLLFSPVMIGVIAGWNWLASSLLMECKQATSTVDFPSHLSSSYSKIAYAGAGNIGVVLTDISIIVTLLGVCVAFQITFATLLREVPGNTLSTTALAVISGLVVYPMSCLRDLDSISSLSLLGMLCLVAGVVAILYHGFQDFGGAAYNDMWGLQERAEEEPSVAMWPETVAGASAFLGVTIFCFDVCSLAFPIEESMRHKAEFSKAVVWALVCVWVVYVLLGDVGAALYVHDPEGGIGENILSNLPVDSTIALMVRWAMACVGLLTYPITLAPAAQMLEHYATSSPLARYLCRPAGASGYSAISEADSAAQAPAPESSVYLRCANRAVMVCATTFVAAAIPCFGMVISLLGGLTIAILDFILPPLLHLRIVGLGVHRRLPQCSDARLTATQDSSCCEDGASLELVKVTRTSTGELHEMGQQVIPERWGNQQRLLCVDAALLIVGMGVCAMTTSMSVRSIVVQVIEGRSC